MEYDKAYCKSLPQKYKDYFMSFDIKDLHKAASYCNLCAEKEACLKLALKDPDTYGTWGGKVFTKGSRSKTLKYHL